MRNAPGPTSGSIGRPVLTRTGEHALRAALFLGGRAGPRLVSAREVARALGTPPNYTGKVLRQLARKGLLRSVRGPQGGFQLRRRAEALSLAEILDAVEEPPAAPAVCLLGDRPCNAASPCGAHRKWTEVQERTRDVLAQTTLADLIATAPAAAPLVLVGGYHA